MSARAAARSVATSAICLRRILYSSHCSTASEHRLALLDECSHGVPIIVGRDAMDVMGGLQIEAVVDLSGHGAVKIFLHIAISDSRAFRQAARNLLGTRGQLVRFTDPVGEPKPQRLLRA